MISALLVGAGIYLGLNGYVDGFPPDLLAIGVDTNDFLMFVGIFLPVVGWLLMYLGITTRFL